MKLRVGLIGLGADWESRHRPALRTLSDRFQVCAVFDQVRHRAEQAAADFEADSVSGYQRLVRRSDLDAVMILSPQWYGPLPIFAACDAGKAVYCAAALDMTPEQALQVKQCVEEGGIAFMAEFSRRLAPATIRLKELIATHLGPPQLLFAHTRSTIAAEPRKCDPACNSPCSRELIELVDWCRYIVGTPPQTVIGIGQDPVHSPAEYQMVSLTFQPTSDASDPPLAQISCGKYIPPGWSEAASFRPPAALQVSCQKGVAFLDLPSSLVWFDEAGRHMESLDSDRPVGEQLFSQFHRAVVSLLRSTADLDHAHMARRVVIAAEESRRSGRRIEMA